MSERLETLKKARERMTEDRDAFAKTLAAPFDRDKAERARLKFIETQVLIDAIDRAIAGEQSGPADRVRRLHACLSSLRGANGSRECAPDDRIRDEAIQSFYPLLWIASLALAMTNSEPS